MSIAAQYFGTAQRLLQRIAQEQGGAIRAAGAIVAAALSRGGVLHVFGAGHSHLLAEEAFFRAGGLAAVNPILDARLIFEHGALESTRAERRSGYAREILAREDVRDVDAAVVISNSGRNAVPIEMALEFRARGVPVIAVTNVEHSRSAAPPHATAQRLFDIAQVTIDTCVPVGDASVDVPGIAMRMGPLSTIAGAAIMHAVIMEAAAELAASGREVPVLPSANLAETTEQMLRDVLQPYHGRIRFLDLDDGGDA